MFQKLLNNKIINSTIFHLGIKNPQCIESFGLIQLAIKPIEAELISFYGLYKFNSIKSEQIQKNILFCPDLLINFSYSCYLL